MEKYYKIVEEVLEEFNIPKYYYSIGGYSEEAVCLVYENLKWKVFIVERGNVCEEDIYDNFLSSAKDVISRLSHSHEEYFLMTNSLMKKLKRK